MDIKNVLRPECLQTEFKGKSKDDVLNVIVDLAVKSPVLKQIDRKVLYQAFKAREELGSTGFGDGIAIPHCRLKNIEEFTIGILLAPKGVKFDSLDGRKCSIFVFIIGPEEKRTEHIQLLSSVSKVLKSKETRKNILSSADTTILLSRFLNDIVPSEKSSVSYSNRCIFTIIIQHEKYFLDILEMFPAEVDGDITVIEASNAGHFLHKMPLYAAYWNETPVNFNRVILATVDKNRMNNIIRKIHTLLGNNLDGVFITVQDTLYSWGKLEL